MSLIMTCLQIGLVFGLMSLGVFISFKILDTPDLTVDGSFTLGASISAILCLHNLPILGLLISLFAGAIAGIITGILHTKLKIQVVLAGILTMTALYSVNFWITGRKSSITLYNNKTIFSFLSSLKQIEFLGTNLKEVFSLLLIIGILVCIILIINYFFKTNLGMAIRATGDNEAMVRASSINTDTMKIISFALANALVAFGGALYVQHLSNYDSQYGVGMMVIGLAAIIIGEAIFKHKKQMKLGKIFIIVVLGAIIYQIIFMLALLIDGINPIDIKIITALIIVLSVYVPQVSKSIKKKRERRRNNLC
ncbi:MAG: ABC transporter permease [Bacilli bacterium]|nr:ABC transporter permease [Bacilli bacterium]